MPNDTKLALLRHKALLFTTFILDCSKCLDVRHPIHHQRPAGLFGVLAHIFNHGSSIFRREILQMS